MANREIRRARRPAARATGTRTSANRSRPFVFGASNNNFKNARNNLNSNNNNNFKNARNNKNFAATKIQALFRGAKARKAFQRIRAATANATRTMNRSVNNAPNGAARNIVRNMRPEARAALQTSTRANNRTFENLAVRNAGRRFPGVNWAVITRDQIRPLANRIGRELTRPNNQKAVGTVMMMFVAVYLFQIDPALMTLAQKQTLRQIESIIPGMMVPISNTNASPWKRMLGTGISTLYPSQERMIYEGTFGNIPAWAFNNKYKRTVYGFMVQYMVLFMSILLARLPWSRKGYTIKAIITILAFAGTLNTTILTVMFRLYLKNGVATAKISRNAFLGSLALVGGAAGGPVGKAVAVGSAGVRLLAAR